jgi:hypothetical protein
MEPQSPRDDSLAGRVAEIERTVANLSPTPSKDIWDKLSAMSGLVSGIVVALIGGYFTYVYNSRSAMQDAQAKEQQARLQELQTVAQLMPYLTSRDENAQKYAITAINVLGSTKIATELARLNPSKGVEAGLVAIAANTGNKAEQQLVESALKQVRCGIEDWSLKTLTDRENSQVDTQPTAATIDELRSIIRPSDPRPNSSDRFDAEKKTYTVRARLASVKLEATSDYDLILTDPANPSHTLTARIPAPECAQQSAFREQFSQARDALKKFGPALDGRGFVESGADVEVQGVGYFTSFHGQHGLAPNGFELHPVLSLKFLPSPGAHVAP